MSEETVAVGERKGFSSAVVERVYIRQDGICARVGCGNPLSRGFHRHHKNKNHSDNSEANCELYCPECHFAIKEKETKENPWLEHKKVERNVFKLVDEMCRKLLDGGLSGASGERVMAGATEMLKISRSEKGIDMGIEYPPPSIKAAISLQYHEEIAKARLEGLEKGILLGIEKGVEIKINSVTKKD